MATACQFGPCCSFHPPSLSSRLRRHLSGPSFDTHRRRRSNFLYTSRKGVPALRIPSTHHSDIAAHDFSKPTVLSVIRSGGHANTSSSQQPSLSYGQGSQTSDRVSSWDAENRKLSLEKMCYTFHSHLVHSPSDTIRDPSVDRESMNSETVPDDRDYLKKVLDCVASLPSPPRQSQGSGGHHFSSREKTHVPSRTYSAQTASGTIGLNGSLVQKHLGSIKEPIHNAFGGRHDDERRRSSPEDAGLKSTCAMDTASFKERADMENHDVGTKKNYGKETALQEWAVGKGNQQEKFIRIERLPSSPRQSQGSGGHHFSSREKTHVPPRVYSAQTASETIGLNGSLVQKHLGDIKEPIHNAFGGRHDDERRTYREDAYGKSTCAVETASFTEHADTENHDVGTEINYGKETALQEWDVDKGNQQEKLIRIYERVLLVDNVLTAKKVVQMLTTKYKDCIHACDTEVANIDVKEETPVAHGDIICFSIYSGAHVDFGNGKSCIWVDVLDGGRDVLMEFAPFFENPSIKKVWHNYSFDSHVIENYGINISGFYADTMHLARLWDSSRRIDGGYSLEGLTSDNKVMSRKKSRPSEPIIGKISMKSIFGKKKVKKDGTEGKLITIPSVEHLQREERKSWICYSALDSMSTLELFNSLKEKLVEMKWFREGIHRGTMYDFYVEYWRPFGALLVKMESEGMLVDRTYLSEIEKVAISEQRLAADQFRKWASTYCADAMYMNVGSDAQLRQLFFGGVQNRKDQNEALPVAKAFKVPNTENVIEEGKKTPSKYRTITIKKIGNGMETEMYTPSGWPSVSGDALKAFAGKIPTEQIFLMDDKPEFNSDNKKESSSNENNEASVNMDASIYGTAYDSFEGGVKGKEACHAIAALCEVCSIDSLISNFILPLQGDHISGRNGRVHCSLNINTETGRLSARRPNLQNQPALEKDRYKIRQAFIAAPGNSLIVADYGQLELRILAHLANCTSMLDAFKAGGDFHSRTAMNMYEHVRKAVEEKRVLLEWHPQLGEDKPPVPLLKDAFAAERRKAKMLNFSIAYGKTPIGLSRDWKVSVKEAKETVKLWYKDRKEVLKWQEERKKEAHEKHYVNTLLGRSRRFPSVASVSNAQRGHIERAAINTPVQGSAADVAMCAMLEIDRNPQLKKLGWKLLLQVHDEVILEGPSDSAETARAIVVDCMSKPFYGKNILKVGLSVDAKCAQNWYAAK